MLTFSIVTPNYNCSRFIEQTINSVINQKGNFYIDYIIVDGNSNDNSLEIIKKYDKIITNGDSINFKGNNFYKPKFL